MPHAAPGPTTSATLTHADRGHRPAGGTAGHAALMRASGTITFSMTARSMACRANSTSPSTAPARSPLKTPTTSPSRQSKRKMVSASRPASVQARHRRHYRSQGFHRYRYHQRWKISTSVSDAIVRVFIDLGDRTNRLKARLKYDRRHGHGEVPDHRRGEVGQPFTRISAEALMPRPEFRLHGAYRSAQTEAGRVELDRRRVAAGQGDDRSDVLSKIAADLGDGDIRLTVWQNLLIPGVKRRECRAGDCGHRSPRSNT